MLPQLLSGVPQLSTPSTAHTVSRRKGHIHVQGSPKGSGAPVSHRDPHIVKALTYTGDSARAQMATRYHEDSILGLHLESCRAKMTPGELAV